MTHNYTVNSFNVTEEELVIIRDCKFSFVELLIANGTRYSSIGAVSGMLNDLLTILNTDEKITFDISDIEIGAFDFENIRKFSKVFYDNMSQKNVSKESISFIKNIINDYLDNLAITTKKIQEERLKLQEEVDS